MISSRRALLWTLAVTFYITSISSSAFTADATVDVSAHFTFSRPGKFRIIKVADSRQAFDIYCMTLDDRGDVVVSGPGYIRRLLDRDGDGSLETIQSLHKEGGAHGLHFVGRTLYFVQGPGVQRLKDINGEGVAAGPAELILPIRSGSEHGTHGLRRGPDGRLYILGGNHCGFDSKSIEGAFSPVRHPYAGLLLRTDLDGKQIEVLAHGMRNAYDFDFNAEGEIFSWDSDGERDVGLPWYRSTRLYHLTRGADCGWRSSGTGKLPTHCFDTIEPVAECGRGSPTGVACYRHSLFPKHYHGGIFALDWTFGRIYHFPLQEQGASYHARVETFAQASNDVAFAPTDVEVAPDGSLFVSCGGRGIEGAVYRIVPTSSPKRRQNTPMLDVLDAPCPLSSWSRGRWLPAARRLGTEAFVKCVGDNRLSPNQRARALDVAFEVTDNSERLLDRMDQIIPETPPTVRARLAARAGTSGRYDLVRDLLGDRDPRVVRVAVEFLMKALAQSPDDHTTKSLLGLASHEDRRVRQAVLWTLLHTNVSPLFEANDKTLTLSYALALQSPIGTFSSAAFGAVPLAKVRSSPGQLLDALRLRQLCLERWHGADEKGVTLRECPASLPVVNEEVRSLLQRESEELVKNLEEANPRLSRQAAAVLCLSRVPSRELLRDLLGGITTDSPAGDDVLRLAVIANVAREAEELDDALSEQLVNSFLVLPRKVKLQKRNRDFRWHRFVGAVWQRFLESHPTLGGRLAHDRRLGTAAEHAFLVENLDPESRLVALKSVAARPFLDDDKERSGYAKLFVSPPQEDFRDLYLRFLEEPDLRSIGLEALAQIATARDRPHLRDALLLGDRQLVEPTLRALAKLDASDPKDPRDTEEIVEILRWGFVLDTDLSRRDSRDLVASELQRITNLDTGYRSGHDGPQGEAFGKWASYLEEVSTELGAAISTMRGELRSDEKQLAEIKKNTAWDQGDAQRGKTIFEQRQCLACHHKAGAGGRAGPDLNGLGRRFSLHDILEATLLPDKVVPPRYATQTFVLKNGERVDGIVFYDSREAVLTQTRTGYKRLKSSEIAKRYRGKLSLMPTGLLDGLNNTEIADLMAYLRSD